MNSYPSGKSWYKFHRQLIAALFVAAAPVASHCAERVLLDDGWVFHRGDTPRVQFSSPGTPVTDWRWIPDDTGRADADKMAAPGLDTSGAGWKSAHTGDDTFWGRVGFSWYRATLPGVSGSAPVLHFGGVDDNATVYLNGRLLATHEGWDAEFDVALASAWRADKPNDLAVLVENTAGKGGISGPVLLQTTACGTPLDPPMPAKDDPSWKPVHLPHDFIVEGTFDEHADRNHGFLPLIDGWYRRLISLPASAKGRSLWLDFDGVCRNSTVWLNGRCLGNHRSGYTSFRHDIALAANYGGDNLLEVHVDPRGNEGWWYEGGGIYRHVWLNLAEPVRVAPWGVFVSSSVAEPIGSGPATVRIQTAVANDNACPSEAALVSRIYDRTGALVATATSAVSIPALGSREVVQTASVASPKLWSPDTPHLYSLVSTLQSGAGPVDTVTTPFGIRVVRFDAEKGLFLNGRPIKIRGTCNHQDFAGLGIAVPDKLEYWRVKTLKQMGANAWRMSHNPPTPSLLDACDDLGMMVMDENRHLGSSPENLAEVASMVRRDRNHPSIVIWSMCNEESATGLEGGAKIFAAMKRTVLENDTTRPVSSANNQGWFGPGFRTVEDLMGVNYAPQVYDKFHKAFPAMPLFASETASTTTTRGEYANDHAKALVSSYSMTDGSWAPVAERDFVAGSFVWTGFDYKGEPTPCNWPSVNSHFGILDLCGFPKDNYWYYLSWWKTEPVVHLMPHWNWSGCEGKPIHVIAFSNCARVELLLNGRSLGTKEMPRNGHLDWNVPYTSGTLLACGFDANGAVQATDSDETTGAPTELRLLTDRTRLAPDGEDVTPVEVDVVDDKGRVVPTADDLITFCVTGAGHIAGVGNGNAGDHDPDKANHRHAFHGKCMVVVGAGDKPGVIALTATAPKLKPASIQFDVVSPGGRR